MNPQTQPDRVSQLPGIFYAELAFYELLAVVISFTLPYGLWLQIPGLVGASIWMSHRLFTSATFSKAGFKLFFLISFLQNIGVFFWLGLGGFVGVFSKYGTPLFGLGLYAIVGLPLALILGFLLTVLMFPWLKLKSRCLAKQAWVPQGFPSSQFLSTLLINLGFFNFVGLLLFSFFTHGVFFPPVGRQDHSHLEAVAIAVDLISTVFALLASKIVSAQGQKRFFANGKGYRLCFFLCVLFLLLGLSSQIISVVVLEYLPGSVASDALAQWALVLMLFRLCQPFLPCGIGLFVWAIPWLMLGLLNGLILKTLHFPKLKGAFSEKTQR